jgi:hypothetical protein
MNEWLTIITEQVVLVIDGMALVIVAAGTVQACSPPPFGCSSPARQLASTNARSGCATPRFWSLTGWLVQAVAALASLHVRELGTFCAVAALFGFIYTALRRHRTREVSDAEDGTAIGRRRWRAASSCHEPSGGGLIIRSLSQLCMAPHP